MIYDLVMMYFLQISHSISIQSWIKLFCTICQSTTKNNIFVPVEAGGEKIATGQPEIVSFAILKRLFSCFNPSQTLFLLIIFTIGG